MNKGSLLFLLLAVNSNIVFTMRVSSDSIVRPQSLKSGVSVYPESKLELPNQAPFLFNLRLISATLVGAQILPYQPGVKQIEGVRLKRCSPEIA